VTAPVATSYIIQLNEVTAAVRRMCRGGRP